MTTPHPGCPCSNTCCADPQPAGYTHDCGADDTFCEECYGSECSNCGSCCWCDL